MILLFLKLCFHAGHIFKQTPGQSTFDWKQVHNSHTSLSLKFSLMLNPNKVWDRHKFRDKVKQKPTNHIWVEEVTPGGECFVTLRCLSHFSVGDKSYSKNQPFENKYFFFLSVNTNFLDRSKPSIFYETAFCNKVFYECKYFKSSVLEMK